MKRYSVWYTQSANGYLFAPDAPAGGTPPPSSEGTSSSTPPASTTPPATPPAGSAGAPPVTSAAPPASGTTRSADGWEPPDRKTFEGIERSRRALTQRTSSLEAELKASNARIAALAGITQTSPEDQTKADVIKAFREHFPQLAPFLDPDNSKRLEKLLTRGDEIEQASNAVWDGVSRRTLTSITSQYADALNLDPKDIDDDARQMLASLFMQMARSDPERFQQRYEAEDPALVTEFIERMTKKFFEPAARVRATQVVRGQPRVPSSGVSRPVVSGPPSFNPADRDSTEDAAIAYVNAHGGFRGSNEV